MWERVFGGWMEDTRVGACDWWVDGGYMCESVCLVGGRGIQVWERVIGGWTGDTCVRACDWWVDGGYKCGSV